MIRKILRFPNPILKKKAKAVKRITPEITKLIDDMLETMRKAPGVGLAAPQIGESVRVIVAELVPEGKEPLTLALVNPKILSKSGKQTFTEGCLCLPGVEAPIERSSKVAVKALNRSGENVEITAEGLLATILQHEIDHLNGIVFTDKLYSTDTLMSDSEFKKRNK